MNLTTDVGTAIPLKVIGLAPKDITPGSNHSIWMVTAQRHHTSRCSPLYLNRVPKKNPPLSEWTSYQIKINKH